MSRSAQSSAPLHLLKNPAQLTYFLVGLRDRSAPDAFQAMADILRCLEQARDLSLDQTYQVLNAIDSAGRRYHDKAASEIAAEPDMRRGPTQALWTAGGRYLAQLASAYEYLAGVSARAVKAPRTQAPHALVLGRALHACATAIAWDYLRYAAQFGRWADLYRLYKAAEDLKLATHSIVLYREEPETTLASEFVQALVLAVAAPHTLQPRQLLAARDIIRALGRHLIKVDDTHRRPFFFDLGSDAPPTRILSGVRPPYTACRFGIGAAEGKLEHWLQRLEHGVLRLAELGLDGADPSFALDLLRHLHCQWCLPPAERKHLRQRELTRLSVVHGFEPVLAHITGRLHTYPFVIDEESWLIENSSERGIGAMLSGTQGPWVEVGSLLCCRRPGTSSWVPAVVRHVRPADGGFRYVGIEMLASRGIAVTLSDRHRQPPAEMLAVWLPGQVTAAHHARLLVAPGTFDAVNELVLQASDQTWLARPVQTLLAGRDYAIQLCALRPNAAARRTAQHQSIGVP